MRIPLELPPGLFGDDTTYAAEGHWADGSNVRFRLGRPEVIGGWESLMTTLLSGVCRTVFPWTDNTAVLNISFGRHNGLDVWQGGQLYNITPYGPPTLLGTNPLATSNTSAVVEVTHTAHGRTTGDQIKISGVVTVGGITPDGGPFTITVDTADTYHFTWTSNATSTVPAGGGTAVVVTPQVVLPAGATDGTGSAGWGTGAFGAGPYGQTSSAVEYFPRTWSLAPWGQNLLASPRGGGLYQWSNVTSTRAVAVANAPTQITHMLVAPLNGGYQVFALGCNQEADGVFNPLCIRHSSIRNLTQWSTLASGSTSREYVLTGGGRIVAGRMCGANMLVWTTDSLFLGTYVGALNQPWRFDRVAQHCGLIGPSAAVVAGQAAYWVSPDRQFFRYGLGGQPTPIPCPIRSDFAEFLAASQGDKVVASSNGEFSEIRFDYPDSREGFENSRYITLAVSGADAGSWHRGIMARTAFVDAGPSLYPVGVTYKGNVYYHERGQSADGSPFAWFIETADNEVDAEYLTLVTEVWPDFRGQVGPVSVTLTASFEPQGETYSETAEPMAPGDQKADIMLSGRLIKARFSGDSLPTACRIGKPVFTVQRQGKY